MLNFTNNTNIVLPSLFIKINLELELAEFIEGHH